MKVYAILASDCERTELITVFKSLESAQLLAYLFDVYKDPLEFTDTSGLSDLGIYYKEVEVRDDVTTKMHALLKECADLSWPDDLEIVEREVIGE
jgi:hypothetical protein